MTDYWQKKPLLIKQALPNFISPIAPEELAGLSLEEEFESRLITGSTTSRQWSLTQGPFSEATFETLPEKEWTLLVQGVDRQLDEIHDLIQHFDFIPRWRFDDVMISYAAQGGSVGPHFDYYDVFLLQGNGQRHWTLSSQFCILDNYLEGVPLRIMDKFVPEQALIAEPGDVLYVPPKIAHHGVSMSDDCTTLSFGYRSYSIQEMFDNLDTHNTHNQYYQDPIWDNTNTPALIPDSAIQVANKTSEISAIDFAKFVTKLDTLDVQILQQFEYTQQGIEFEPGQVYQLHSACKIAYLLLDKEIQIFLNGLLIKIEETDVKKLIDFCNKRTLSANNLPNLAQQLFNLDMVYEI
ncbi:cupin domain-containing protein [Candidatus Thioglobus sp.]|nr:cupin domain-containing protein [Candidatus Thioglobus sp.]